ncbi:protein translocase subunit secG [Litoreibacter ascidiaceicola]|uniref:Protein-export membrane protein SecG n=1 Tax=Litoreibacter ascidiaceicola TaxID=1486859 RepID=A0A1M4TCP2_9RHOB|nr:preprotein translocase subunit SecG [Litoreibacter ascidiaceicola]SHE42236.1 protein translocase subunit secG [Litoreibacter ascidiaceicola]
MENIILTVHLIVALCLIVIVLIQRSEGGGLGMGGGGGGGGAMSGRPAISALGKLTWLFGVAFVITSISLTVMAARNSNNSSVLDTSAITAPAEVEAPAGDALLPPTLPATGDAPLAPPRIDD